ncbi:MAG: carboxymuconolactone decarboxylase family protein [Moraxellaceae bacterium]|nr:carboxymuconolactone decarboxylase family protein [Moraxellaceae bacterium]
MSTHDSNQPRLPFYKLGGKPIQALIDFSGRIKESSIGPALAELIFLRVSQLNGCAFCLDMHWSALIKSGEDARKLNMVAAWQEAPFFSPRERAALGWAEALTLPPHPQREADQDAVFATLREHFSDQEAVEVTMAIANMNAWNRISVGMRNPVPA